MIRHLDNHHDRLMRSSSWYKSWHEKDKYHIKNWLIFGTATLGAFLLVYNTIKNNEPVLAFANPGPIVSSSTLTNGLVGHWNLNDGIGTVAVDISGNKNNSTLVGGASWTQGKTGTGVNLNGINGYVNIPDSSLFDGMPSVTVSAWVNLAQLPIQNYVPLGKDGGDYSYRITIGPSGIANFTVNTTNNAWYTKGTNVKSSTPLPLNTWKHIVGTYDGKYVRIYIDGVLAGVGLQPISGNIINSVSPLRLGNKSSGNIDYMKGIVDEVRIYNRVLDTNEVTDLYVESQPISVSIIGSLEKVYDWSSQRCEDLDVPDGAPHAFRDENGTVNLLSGNYVNYRMTGSSLNLVTKNCTQFFNSAKDKEQFSSKYFEWFVSPYTQDGRTIYGLIHNEWYAYLVDPKCQPEGYGVSTSGWVSAITLATSIDRGTSYTHPGDYKIQQSSLPWSTNFGCDSSNSTRYGAFQFTNLVQKNNYFYSVYRTIADPLGVGISANCLMRTQDLSKGSAWEVLTQSGWDKSLSVNCQPLDNISGGAIPPFGPSLAPRSLSYNSYLGAYVLIFGGAKYSLSSDLINWSLPDVIPLVSSNPISYPSLLDPNDKSMNFELSGQDPYIYYNATGDSGDGLDRDLVRQKIHFVKNASYVQPLPPPAPTIIFSATPIFISAGGSATLNWTSNNTVPSCNASGVWSGSRPTSGSQTVSPTVTSTYTLVCTGPGGIASQSTTVTVNTPPPITFQQSTDFSLTKQGNRGWYYLDSMGQMKSVSIYGGVWQGSDQYTLIGKRWVHPGGSVDAILRWVAPQAGSINITDVVKDSDSGGGDGVLVNIKRNGVLLENGSIVLNNGNTTGVSINITTNVNIGDQIEFVVNKRNNNYWDSTIIDPKIVLTP